MEKNVLIVNYNTTLLTQCCIKSINKFTPGCKIYVFDNSDKEFFVNIFDNVKVFNNTNSGIIDFNKWLSGIKTKVPNGYQSAKHCYSIQKSIDIIDDNIVLLDSDVLLKKDITDLFDENYIYVGDSEKYKGVERVIPYCCFINVNECKKQGITYYNEQYMLALTPNNVYDTGAYFYMRCKDFPHKRINYNDYVVHLDNGSFWYDNKKRQEIFLSNNKHLWC